MPPTAFAPAPTITWSSHARSSASLCLVSAAHWSSSNAAFAIRKAGPETAQGPNMADNRRINSGSPMAKPRRKPASPQNFPKLFKMITPDLAAWSIRLCSGQTSQKLSSIMVRSASMSAVENSRPSGLFGWTRTRAAVGPSGTTCHPPSENAAACSLYVGAVTRTACAGRRYGIRAINAEAPGAASSAASCGTAQNRRAASSNRDWACMSGSLIQSELGMSGTGYGRGLIPVDRSSHSVFVPPY